MRSDINTNREALGDFGPAFVSDLIVPTQIEADERLVDLRQVNARKDTVSGS